MINLLPKQILVASQKFKIPNIHAGYSYSEKDIRYLIGVWFSSLSTIERLPFTWIVYFL